MRKIAVLVSIILISNGLFAQKDFLLGTKHKNSITSVYYTFIGKDYTTSIQIWIIR
jgi:hypothetical protein